MAEVGDGGGDNGREADGGGISPGIGGRLNLMKWAVRVS